MLSHEPGRSIVLSEDSSKIFYDVEASSLAAASFPIEVGWAEVLADGSVRSKAILIRPADGWVDWAELAERIHGISRGQLEELGRPVIEVVEELDAAFGDGTVLSDNPAWEVMWTDRLYLAAGRKRRWGIGNAVSLLRATAASSSDLLWLSVHLEDTRLHRADADAAVLAEGYAELRRRARDRTDS